MVFDNDIENNYMIVLRAPWPLTRNKREIPSINKEYGKIIKAEWPTDFDINLILLSEIDTLGNVTIKMEVIIR